MHIHVKNLPEDYDEFIKVFSQIRSGYRSVDLSNNNLGNRSCYMLAEAFELLPYLSDLNLTNNNLHAFTLDDLQNLKGSLKQVQTVYLSHNEVTSMPYENFLALKEIMPATKTFIFLNKRGEEVDFIIPETATKIASPIKPLKLIEPSAKKLAIEHASKPNLISRVKGLLFNKAKETTRQPESPSSSKPYSG